MVTEAGSYMATLLIYTGELYWTYVTDDQQYALTYQCTQRAPDGTCQEKVIDVNGRSKEFPEDVRVVMRLEVQKLCVQPGEFLETSFNGACINLFRRPPTKYKIFMYMYWGTLLVYEYMYTYMF